MEEEEHSTDWIEGLAILLAVVSKKIYSHTLLSTNDDDDVVR